MDDLWIGRLPPEDREIGESFTQYLRQLTAHYQTQVAASHHGEADPEFAGDHQYWLDRAREVTEEQLAIILQSMVAAAIQTVRWYRQLEKGL